MPRKKIRTKPSKKLSAFVEMVGEDVNDALEHKLHPGEMVVALLMYATALAMDNADMDADEYMDFAAQVWNERVDRLEEEEEEEECPLPFQEDVEE